jgi:hypothetical protein
VVRCIEDKDKLRSDGLTDSYELQVYDKKKRKEYGLLALKL